MSWYYTWVVYVRINIIRVLTVPTYTRTSWWNSIKILYNLRRKKNKRILRKLISRFCCLCFFQGNVQSWSELWCDQFSIQINILTTTYRLAVLWIHTRGDFYLIIYVIFLLKLNKNKMYNLKKNIYIYICSIKWL